MAWDPTKPANADLVFNSVGSTAIRGNFAAIDTAWDINHVGIGDANQGKHNAVHYREVADPTMTTNEVALYAADTALTAYGTELFFKRESAIGTAAYPITGALRAQDEGWTFLPSGILVKWGVHSGSGSRTYTYATGATYKAFTAIYQVQITVYNTNIGDTDDAVRLKSVASTTSFDYYASARSTVGAKTVPFAWLAIGSGV